MPRALTPKERAAIYARRFLLDDMVRGRAAAWPDLWKQQLCGVRWANGPEGILSATISGARCTPTTFFLFDEIEEALRDAVDPLPLVQRFAPQAWVDHMLIVEARAAWPTWRGPGGLADTYADDQRALKVFNEMRALIARAA